MILTLTSPLPAGVRSDAGSEPTTDGNIKVEKLERPDDSGLEEKLKDGTGVGVSIATSQPSSNTPTSKAAAPPPAKRIR